MPKFQKKTPDATGTTTTESPKSQKGLVDGARYAKAAETLQPLIEQLEGVRKSLVAGVADVASIEEARRQEAAVYEFNLSMERAAKHAEYEKEYAEREEEFAKRDQALTAAELLFFETVGIAPTPGDHLATGKAVRAAFDAKLQQQYKDGEKAGKEAAAAAYGIQKRLDDAAAKTELELLKQQNAQLAAANAELKKQNEALLAAQAKTNDTVADVAKKGLEAAAGVVQQGNQALGTAAGAFPSGSRTGR